MKILISNDDGINARGIITLAERLNEEHDVFVVAPKDERSASSHSLTLRRPLKVNKVKKNYYSVDGTPADCVNLAVNGILPIRPDLVVSGINHGGNLGDDVFYSGTVSAAFEGMLLDIPSIAISYEMKVSHDFSPAADFAARLINAIEKMGFLKDTVLNVNVPDKIRDGKDYYRITRQGKRSYDNSVVEKTDPDGGKYYMIGDARIRFDEDIESDFFAVVNGYVSITPLHLDLTNYLSIKELRDWEL